MKCIHINLKGKDTSKQCNRNTTNSSKYCHKHEYLKEQVSVEKVYLAQPNMFESLVKELLFEIKSIHVKIDDLDEMNSIQIKRLIGLEKVNNEQSLLLQQQSVLLQQQTAMLLEIKNKPNMIATDEGIAASIKGDHNNIKPQYNIIFYGELASKNTNKLYNDLELQDKIVKSINGTKNITDGKEIAANILDMIQKEYGYKQISKFDKCDKHKVFTDVIKFINDANEKRKPKDKIKLMNKPSEVFANMWSKAGSEFGESILKSTCSSEEVKELFDYRDSIYAIF